MASFLSSTLNSLPSLHDLLLPTPEVYVTLLNIWQWFPLFTIILWLTPWHPAGKSSVKSYFNIPGRIGWFAMEIAGPINLVYILYNLPSKLNIQILPLPNKLVASLYLIHYVNRAIISPFFAAPSMSPIHAFIVTCAVFFNWFNSSCLACWLVGYNVSTIPGMYPGPSSPSLITTPEKIFEDSLAGKVGTSLLLPALGLVLFITGMAGNIYAERTLFSLRRNEADRKQSDAQPNGRGPITKSGNKYSKIYVIPPQRGLFTSILYPHYALEWLEWAGFTLAGLAVFPALSPPSLLPDVLTPSTSPPLRLAPWLVPAVWAAGKLRIPVLPLPAIVFVVNAVTNMLPHARWGRKWYVEKFGEEKVGGRGAVVPYCSWM